MLVFDRPMEVLVPPGFPLPALVDGVAEAFGECGVGSKGRWFFSVLLRDS